MEKTQISLSQLSLLVKQAIAVSMPDSFWVVAEIAEFREHRNGHCYLELIEKDAATNQVTARMRANIWSYAYRLLKPYFETTTRQRLMPGIKVLVKGSVEYQEVFGLSLNIKDIDPSFTLGDIERQRRQVIAQLEDEGVLEMNKELPLPTVVQRIAIISSPSAAGYEDFVTQLKNNSAGVKYYHKLFPAIMQGEQTETSVVAALEKIYEHEAAFDVVVIVRGGGATADLMSFDSYAMALNITQFPLPVFTGIGHERDFSVADLVAHTHLKTPTAVAEFIIQHNQVFVDELGEAQEAIVELVSSFVQSRHERLNNASTRFVPAVNRHLQQQKARLLRLGDKSHFLGVQYIRQQKNRIARANEKLFFATHNRLSAEKTNCKHLNEVLVKATKRFVAHQRELLDHKQSIAHLNDPYVLLKRGYSITMKDGMAVKSATGLRLGDVLETRFAEGSVTSIVGSSN